MKNKIKFMALILTFMMAATALTGCGAKKESAAVVNYGGAKVVYNGDKIYPVQCSNTLDYYVDFSASSDYENFGDMPIAKAIEKQTGIKVNYIHPTSTEQFQLLIASNEIPDIVRQDFVNFTGGPQYAIDEDYIYSLNDIIDRFSPNLKKVLKENESWDKQSKTDNGDYFVYPFFYGGDLLKVASGPAFRKDWLDKCNLKAPETIDEWEKVLTAFKDKCGAEAPMTGDFYQMAFCLAPAFGIWNDWYLDGDKVEYGPYTAGYKQLLMHLNDWYKKGLIDADFATVDAKKVDANMLNGKSGAVYAWAGSGLGQWLKSATQPGYDLVGAKYAVAKNCDTPEYSVMAGELLTSAGAAISKNCKNVELAARLLDYGYSEAGHILYNFGIEGESFNWVDKNGEKYPQYTDLIMKNDKYTVSQVLTQYNFASSSGIMVQDERYIEQYYPTTQQKEAQKTWAISNMKKHILPQVYLKAEENEENSKIMADLKTYVDEMTSKFITGKESFDNYDAYVKQLEDFGVKTVIGYRQTAYERYKTR